ncbi:MAG: hypothetical protein RI991_1601, partial [Bacteroidota bacterium]
KALLLLMLFFFSSSWMSGHLHAQIQNGDSLLVNASAAYLKLMGENASLFNGAEYVSPRQQIDGFPFYGQENQFKGTLYFSGVWYFNLPIHLDLVNDKMLMWSFDGSRLLVLNAEKIERVKLGEAQFVNGDLISNTGGSPKTGFYQLIYDGRIKVLAKRQKVIVQKSSSDRSYAFYKEFIKYYIVVDGKWSEIGSKNSVLNLLSDKRDALKGFINKENLSYKKSTEQFLEKVVSFYETAK